MELNEFRAVLADSLNIINVGINLGYFEQEDSEKLNQKLLEVFKKGIVSDIGGTAIYGYYNNEEKKLYFNAKVFKDDMEALIYALHEIKHAIDDNGDTIGYEDQIVKRSDKVYKGVGRNEGATQRFATDVAESILNKKIEKQPQYSLGIKLDTNLDEYQIEDRINELFCMAMGISRAEFIKMQNNPSRFDELKNKFNEFSDFEEFDKSLDGIYGIQTELWFDENDNFKEVEDEPTPEQTERARELIARCQSQIIQYAKQANVEQLDKIKANLIMVDEKIQGDEYEIVAESSMEERQKVLNDLLQVTEEKVIPENVNRCDS